MIGLVNIPYFGSPALYVKIKALYEAYLADAFDEDEYAEHRTLMKSQQQILQAEVGRLEEGLMLVEQFEERKQEILMTCQTSMIDKACEMAVNKG